MLLQLLSMCEEVRVEEVLRLVNTHLQPHRGIKGVVSSLYLTSLTSSFSLSSLLAPTPLSLSVSFSYRKKKVSILAVSLRSLLSISLED